MAKTLYVGNLPWELTSEELKNAFAAQAQVIDARIVTDKVTGRSRGFGFVEVADSDADKTIAAMNGAKLKERELIVNEAKPRQGRT